MKAYNPGLSNIIISGNFPLVLTLHGVVQVSKQGHKNEGREDYLQVHNQ